MTETTTPVLLQYDETPDDGMKEFMLVVRQALLMIVAYIERRYGLGGKRIK